MKSSEMVIFNQVSWATRIFNNIYSNNENLLKKTLIISAVVSKKSCENWKKLSF
jgi:hypothetical protein